MRIRSRVVCFLGPFLLGLGVEVSPASAQMSVAGAPSKVDPLVRAAASRGSGSSPVIVRASSHESLPQLSLLIQQAGGTLGRQLPIVDSRAALVPNTALMTLAGMPLVAHVSLDRRIVGAMERTGAAVGATAVRQELGYDGAGIGVAVIDSGLTSWHDDLAGAAGQRASSFVDLVRGRPDTYDDYGHGTHVAGIVAGNGFDSSGARAGIAPASHLVVLKALDEAGTGRISDVIAALDFIVSKRTAYNIRVVNLSVAAAVHESYNVDPLTLAAKRAVAAGIVVVAAAGNAGRDPQGRTQYGAITAPGNAPWVLTVGASSHMGTIDRADDTIAAFSSRGPTAVDRGAKPDLVAPGVGIESLSDPQSAFYTTKSKYLLAGAAPLPYLPYLSLSGTSMAAPVISGIVALMLQANPALTPNEVKAILQFTAEIRGGDDVLTQGAGLVNAKGAVAVARFLALPSGAYPDSSGWSRHLIWGNQQVGGGRLTSTASAWSPEITWGSAVTAAGRAIEWGVICSTSACDAGDGSSVPWGVASTRGAQNVVWATSCGGADCLQPWSLELAGTMVATADDDTVVWGSSDDDTVVWGSSDEDAVVWGSSQ